MSNPNLDQYIIAERHSMGGWPARYDEVLKKNRVLHDQGLVTMCQGRQGSRILQYAIPTKQRVIRSPYFSGASV